MHVKRIGKIGDLQSLIVGILTISIHCINPGCVIINLIDKIKYKFEQK